MEYEMGESEFNWGAKLVNLGSFLSGTDKLESERILIELKVVFFK
jgi:hypothetical protein